MIYDRQIAQQSRDAAMKPNNFAFHCRRMRAALKVVSKVRALSIYLCSVSILSPFADITPRKNKMRKIAHRVPFGCAVSYARKSHEHANRNLAVVEIGAGYRVGALGHSACCQM